MTEPSSPLVWVSPLPPVASGVSQYSRDLLSAVDGTWSMHVVPEPGSRMSDWTSINPAPPSMLKAGTTPIYNLGNSGFHVRAFESAIKYPGVLVLHDVVLHHARLARFVQQGRGKDYVRIMRDRYGSGGERAAREILRGASLDLDQFPLSEDYIEASKMVVVHSDYAKERVRGICPGASVYRVPMGVPVPALTDQMAARWHLDLPESAFVIASITHVNPMKRIHIILRALRRAVERVPEAMLVIAGSVSPTVNLERQVSLLGLERHVRISGYLSDDDSRALARACDVAVNLRYPSAGETSASLLRLLGAGRPVIVTAHGPALELPDDVAIKIPVDRVEQEVLCETLVWLAGDECARTEFGDAARAFIRSEHTMLSATNGYRTALQAELGIDLPELGSGVVVEDMPALSNRREFQFRPLAIGRHEERVVAALGDLRLDWHDGTIQAVSEALVEPGLNQHGRNPGMSTSHERQIAPELLEVLACPVCKTSVTLEDGQLVCDNCGRRYRVEDGIPIMLVDDQQK